MRKISNKNAFERFFVGLEFGNSVLIYELGLKRANNFINVAKALIITHINCPDLKVGAIENQPLTGL